MPWTAEEKRSYQKRYREQNKEKIREYQKQYRQRPGAKERAAELQRLHRANDPEWKARADLIARESYRRNREARLAYEARKRRENPDLFRERKLKASYGLTLADVDMMFDRQSGRCPICTNELRRKGTGGMAVDHCHETGVVRELLCAACNTGLGKMHDDPAALRRAADYIEKHRAK